MADDKTKVAPGDRSRVNINEDYEVSYWTRALGCTKQELEKAVKEVGVSASAVKKYFKIKLVGTCSCLATCGSLFTVAL